MIGGMIVSWTVFYAVSKAVVDLTGSALLSGALIRLGALLFLTIQIAASGKFRLLFKQGRTTWILVLIGVFGFLLDLFANLGYRYGSLGTGTALLKTDVLMVNLASVVIYRKKLRLIDWIATALMLFGVFLVLEIDVRDLSFRFTDLFFLLSALAVSVNAFIIRYVQKKRNVDADVISYYNNFVVLLLFSISAGVTGDFSRFSLRAFEWWFLPLVALGGLAQTGIYFFYYRNLKRFEVWQVKLYLLLMPVLSAVAGVLFFGEKPGVWKTIGIFVVLFGASIVVLSSRKQKLSQKEQVSE